MQLCNIKISGNVKVDGIYHGSWLEIVSGPGSVYRPKEADQPVFEAKEIHLSSVLKIAKGATVKTELLSAYNVEVHGTLIADKIVVSNILEVFSGGTLNGDAVAAAIRVHSAATLLGKIKERLDDNVVLAKIHLKHPEMFSDFRWLENSLELLGWRCIARSSSGNGCNYELKTTEVHKSMYVPLREGISDFIPTLTRVLRRIAGEAE